MVFAGIIVGLIIMGLMISMATNKNSSFPIRVASLIALALMILTVIICLFVIFTDNRVFVDESVIIVGAPVEVKETNPVNIIFMIFLFLFLAALFAVIVHHALKEHRKTAETPVKRFSF